MDVEKLKQKILDLAIRGKLVPQDPDGEPASVLIEKIRAEKENLIKQGKIKRDKNESYVFKGDDNSYYQKFLFDLPKSWALVRFGDIVSIRRGASPRPIKAHLTTREDGVNWIKIGDTRPGDIYISETKQKILKESAALSVFLEKGTLVLSNSMSFGRPYILNIDGCIHDGWLAIEIYNNTIDKEFLQIILQGYMWYFKNKATGTGVDNLNIDRVQEMPFALPPLEEQRRILNSLRTYHRIINEIADSYCAINNMTSLLKYKILDLFFGENSRYKSYSENMKDLGVLVSGRDLTPDCYNSNNNGIPYLTGASNFENDTVIVNRWTPKPVVISYFNDVLITCKGTIGKTAINQIGECHIARQIMAFRCGEKLFPEYVKMYFDYKTQELQRASSSLIPGISRDVMLNMEIPVPEIETQIQIVSRIKSMFALLGKIDS